METLKQYVKSIQSYGDIDIVLFSLLLTLNKLRTLFWCLSHIETSKMICFANQLTCFHVMEPSDFTVHLEDGITSKKQSVQSV